MIDGLRESRIDPDRATASCSSARPRAWTALELAARRGNPPPVGRAEQLLLDRRRRARAEAGPPRAGRHPSGRRDDPLPDRARLRQHRAAVRRAGARRRATARRTRWPGAGLRAQPGRRLGLDARLPGPRRRGAGADRRGRGAGRRGSRAGRVRRLRGVRPRHRHAPGRAARRAVAADRRARISRRSRPTTPCSTSGREGAIEQIDAALDLLGKVQDWPDDDDQAAGGDADAPRRRAA